MVLQQIVAVSRAVVPFSGFREADGLEETQTPAACAYSTERYACSELA
jgi:hypothetical protein